MSEVLHHSPNPRRVAAGRLNQLKRGPLTEAGRQRLREHALRHRPWLCSTGPRSAEGRAQSALNGKRRQQGLLSVREARRELAAVRALIRAVGATCEEILGR